MEGGKWSGRKRAAKISSRHRMPRCCTMLSAAMRVQHRTIAVIRAKPPDFGILWSLNVVESLVQFIYLFTPNISLLSRGEDPFES